MGIFGNWFPSDEERKKSDAESDDRTQHMPGVRNNETKKQEFRDSNWRETKTGKYAEAQPDDALKDIANGQIQNAITGASFNLDKLHEAVEQGDKKEEKVSRHFTEKPLDAASRMLDQAKKTAEKTRQERLNNERRNR